MRNFIPKSSMKEWVKPVLEILSIQNTFGICNTTTPGKVNGIGDFDFPDDCTATS
jgi:hypothetical protein